MPPSALDDSYPDRGGSQARHVRVRLQHQCEWCPRPIRPGDSYSRWAVFMNGKDGPRVHVIRIHLVECPGHPLDRVDI